MGLFRSKKERDEYIGPNGEIKKLLKVVERLPDGTRVFENGWMAAPSKVDFGGERGEVRLDEMTPEEKRDWEKGLMEKVGKSMSDYYRSLETGAGKYS